MGQLCSTETKIKIKIYNPQEIMLILDQEQTRKNLETLSVQFKNSISNLFKMIDIQMTQNKQKLLFETDRGNAHNSIHKSLKILFNQYYLPFQQNFMNVAYPILEICVVKILIEAYLAMKTLMSKQEIWWDYNYFQIRKRVLVHEYKMDIKPQKPSTEAPFIEYIQLLIDILEALLNQACVVNLKEKKTIQQISESHTDTNIFYVELRKNIDL